MSAKETRVFVRRILSDVKLCFPELYKKNILGRREAFISENAPTNTEENFVEILGYVNKDERLLFAMGSMFDNTYSPNIPDLSVGVEDVSTECRNLQVVTSGGMTRVCLGGFSHSILTRYRKRFNAQTESLMVRNDWSVVRITRSAKSRTLLDVFLDISSVLCFAKESAGIALELAEAGQILPLKKEDL